MLLSSEVTRQSWVVMDKILGLFVPLGSIIYDVTFASGAFWSASAYSKYRIIGSDLAGYPAHVAADFGWLPYRTGSGDCVVVDPPFGCLSTSPRRDWVASQYRLEVIGGENGLREMYRRAIIEACRVVTANGHVIVKGQNEVNSGKKHWLGLEIRDTGTECGLRVLDWALQVNEHPPAQPGDRTQRHFRENVTIWWVFKKRKPRRKSRC